MVKFKDDEIETMNCVCDEKPSKKKGYCNRGTSRFAILE
jgi:hypothetical protein